MGVSLLALRVEYAFLWGFLAAVFRYIPYIGIWIAAVPPLILSLAMFPGWVQPLLLIGLFLAIELTASNVIEPRLYGHSIGVSEVALLVAAALWAFLWGPIGLILSSPLTVCLVVLGKYVPQLKFLDVLLGDEPALTRTSPFTSGCWPATRTRRRNWSWRRPRHLPRNRSMTTSSCRP